MDVQCPVPLQQVRTPIPIFLVHRTKWYKYFHYRKWRCDETTDLMGAHSSLEGAHGAVVVDFQKKAEGSRTRWYPDFWKERMEKHIEEWAPAKQFNFINQFMAEKKREDKEVDVGWTYLVTSTSLWQHSHDQCDKKRKSWDVGDERATVAIEAGAPGAEVEAVERKPKSRDSEKLQMVIVKRDADDDADDHLNKMEFNKENNCPSCLKSRPKAVGDGPPEKIVVVEDSALFGRERRSLGYYCQQ